MPATPSPKPGPASAASETLFPTRCPLPTLAQLAAVALEVVGPEEVSVDVGGVGKLPHWRLPLAAAAAAVVGVEVGHLTVAMEVELMGTTEQLEILRSWSSLEKTKACALTT